MHMRVVLSVLLYLVSWTNICLFRLKRLNGVQFYVRVNPTTRLEGPLLHTSFYLVMSVRSAVRSY